MTALDRLTARRAVESLRSGVPSSAAVKALGWTTVAHAQRFKELISGNTEERGLLVKGDFGSGKSHLLGYLEQLALEENFVVSRVVISKETPLFGPDVFTAAIRDGKVPGARGAVLHELAPRVDFRSPRAHQLLVFASHAPGMVAGSIRLIERTVELGDDELIARIIDWWSGERLSPSEVRAGLRKVGDQKAFDVKPIKATELPSLRIALASEIIRAAGFAGWVILLDELELIGRYSNLQRAKSYAQLARWLGRSGELGTSISCVGTITGDFEQAILDGGKEGRNDRAALPAWLRQRGQAGDAALASSASAGMELIDSPNALHLGGPDSTVLRHAYEGLLEVYETAFGWTPPRQVPTFVSTTTPMRTYIKTWIYGWDLVRLRVTERPSIETEALVQSYAEDLTLELGPEESEEEL